MSPKVETAPAQRFSVVFAEPAKPRGYQRRFELQGVFDGDVIRITYDHRYASQGRSRGAAPEAPIHWQHTLSGAWRNEMRSLLQDETLKTPQPHVLGGSRWQLTIIVQDGREHKGAPQLRTRWEMLAREIHEAARADLGLGQPPALEWVVIDTSGHAETFTVQAEALARQAHGTLTLAQGKREQRSHALPYALFRDLRHTLGQLSFHSEGATGALPKAAGTYVHRNGEWFALGSGIRPTSSYPQAAGELTHAMGHIRNKLLQAAPH